MGIIKDLKILFTKTFRLGNFFLVFLRDYIQRLDRFSLDLSAFIHITGCKTI